MKVVPIKVTPHSAVKNEKTLLEEFGGEQKLRTFVTEMISGFMGCPELREAHSKFEDETQMALFQEKMFQFFKFKMGGSKRYLGVSIEEVHRNMGITDELFD